MHPTQRKLMKRIILFLSLLFPITCPAIAGQDIDLVANVKNSTCKSGISNQGNIDLGVVGVGYFSGNVTPESYQPGGKEFTVTVSDCALQGTGDVLNQLHIDFRALSGVMAAGSRQIFANEVTTGAKMSFFSVSFRILSIRIANIRRYARMQKIDPALDVISGQVMSHILVDVHYE
ncbi:fimbrial protein StaF [Escherichia coli]|nr:fimbrial protein StaF [Escherichia coli]